MTTPEDHGQSVAMLRIAAEHLKQIRFPQLTRPAVGLDAPPTAELLHCLYIIGGQRIGLSRRIASLDWSRHMSALLNGIILLTDNDNKAAVPGVKACGGAFYA